MVNYACCLTSNNFGFLCSLDVSCDLLDSEDNTAGPVVPFVPESEDEEVCDGGQLVIPETQLDELPAVPMLVVSISICNKFCCRQAIEFCLCRWHVY